MKIYAFADEAGSSLEAQISAMLRNGICGPEVRNTDGVNVSDLTPVTAKEIFSRLTDKGLDVYSLGSPIGKTVLGEDDFRAETDRLKRTLETANLLGAKRIRMFSFYPRKGHRPDECRSEVMDRLNEMAYIAGRENITLCHENEKGIYGDTAMRCLDIVTEIPAIRNVFDPANYIQCGEDTWQAWQLMKKHTEYMHVKDALKDGTVVPAGKGLGNVRRIAKEYLENGGEVFTIEPHLKVFSGLEKLEAEGARSGIADAYSDSDTAFDAAVNAFKTLMD